MAFACREDEMKKTIFFKIGVGVWIGAYALVVCAQESSVFKIQTLRALQPYASVGQFNEIEKQIVAIKTGAEIDSIKSEAGRVKLSHILPFLIWQIVFLMALALFLFYRRVLWGVICLFSLLILLFGYIERLSEWRIISCRKDLHIGPGFEYPIRIPLPALEELRVLRRRRVNGTEWIFVKCRDCEGWIEDGKCA